MINMKFAMQLTKAKLATIIFLLLFGRVTSTLNTQQRKFPKKKQLVKTLL